MLVTEKFVFVDETPFKYHEKLSGSELASVPITVRLILPLIPTKAPVAAGDNDAQTGGVFLFTVHDFVAELDPLLAVATSVLLPILKSEESNVLLFDAEPETGLPFKTHVTAQLASLVVTEKALLVPEAAAIR